MDDTLMPKRDTWQGRADCLCGIYCALDVIRDSKTLGQTAAVRERRGLYWLLKSAEKLGYLDAEHLAGSDGGFTSEQIEKIFNSLRPQMRHGLIACQIQHILPEYSGWTPDLKPIFEHHGCVMASVSNGKHWILVRDIASDGRATCFDPSLDDRKYNERRKQADEEGLAFLKPKMIERLHAQTN